DLRDSWNQAFPAAGGDDPQILRATVLDPDERSQQRAVAPLDAGSLELPGIEAAGRSGQRIRLIDGEQPAGELPSVLGRIDSAHLHEHRAPVEATSSDLTRLPPVDLGLPQYALTKRAEALLRLVRQHAYPHLAAEPVRLQDFADRDEGSAHPALAQVPGFAALAA